MDATEVGQAFEEMKRDIVAGTMTPEKQSRIDVVLDAWEEKSQAIVLHEQKSLQQADEIQTLTDTLEAKGVEVGEVNRRCDELEAAWARSKNAGHRSEGVEFNQTEEFKGMNLWCREGTDALPDEVKALLRTDSAVDGGILTTTEMDPSITKRITEIDPLRGVCRVRTISNKSLELPIRTSIPVARYEGEAGAAQESSSKYDNVTVTPYRQTFQTPVTFDMLNDAVFNMESEITSDGSEAFAFGEGEGFVIGDGVKQPSGFVNNVNLQTAATAGDTSALVSVNDMIKLTGELKAGYNPLYVLNRRTFAHLRGQRADAVSAADQKGAFLWQPGMNGSDPGQINGYNYILANSMPDMAADSFSVAFGDFRRGYTIVDRTGLSIIRDHYTRAGEQIVVFTMARWNTGMVVLEEAIQLLQCAS